MYVTEPV